MQKVSLLLLFSSFEVHWLLFNLLPKFHLILIVYVLQVTLLVDLVLDLPNNYCHLVGNDVLVLTVSDLTGLILLVVELGLHVPSLVVADLAENSLVLSQVVQATIYLH